MKPIDSKTECRVCALGGTAHEESLRQQRDRAAQNIASIDLLLQEEKFYVTFYLEDVGLCKHGPFFWNDMMGGPYVNLLNAGPHITQVDWERA